MDANKVVAKYKELENDIKKAYEESPSLDEAERLAAKFLTAQMSVSRELAAIDLDARMKKSGLKAIKSAVYLDGASRGERKPSDTLLQAVIDRDETVQKAQDDFDATEVAKDLLHNYLQIFRDAHIYYRGIARGKFE